MRQHWVQKTWTGLLISMVALLPVAAVLLVCATGSIDTTSSAKPCMMCSHLPEAPMSPDSQTSQPMSPADSSEAPESCGEYSFEMHTGLHNFSALVLIPRGHRAITQLQLQSRDLTIAPPPPRA